MADFTLPTVNDTYANYLAYLKNRDIAVAGLLDPAYQSDTNIPTNSYRLNSAANRFERYNGSSWVEAIATWAASISGNAATATVWATGRTISLTGDVSGTSGAFNGSANLSFSTTLATVTAAKGGTGQTSYTIGDILYASGATALSKLAGVATGNALISGGVGAAPTWGKVGLTTHVSGTLAATNGGTGLSAYTTGDILYSSGTNTLAALAAAAAGNVLISGATPSWGKVALTTHVSGTLPIANGGTNITSYTTGDLLYASATNVLSKLPGVATGNVLISGGVGAAFSWGKVALTTHVSGILPGANGGTNNGFMQFTGPATALKTYTLPNVDATLLYSGGDLGTPSAGNLTNCTFPTLNQNTTGTAANATEWAGAAYTVSTSTPSGGADGDFWFEREA